MKMEMHFKGLDDVLATLNALPLEIVSKKGGPVKNALRRGARQLRDAAEVNLREAIARGGSRSTGLLEKNLIASRGKPPVGSKGERYLVRVKRKTYPGRKPEQDGRVATVRKSAQLLEWGSSQQQATPWLRPAVAQHGAAVIETIRTDLLKRIDSTVKRIAKNGGGR